MAVTDLPDWYTQVSGVELEAYTIRGGADAAKSASPTSKDVYLATDTKILYVCVADGSWTGFDASILVQGTLTLYANMIANSKKITGLAAPTAANDAARKAYVDTVDAKLDDSSVAQPTRVLGTSYQNSTKLRLVIYYIVVNEGQAIVEIGAADPPTTEVGQVVDCTSATYELMITILVPASYYYRIRQGGATITLVRTTEIDLF